MELTVIPVGIMRTNCYIVASAEKNAVVIDPGDDGGRLADRITNMGISVKYIFLTHGHFDHTGAVKETKKRTGAKLAVSREDIDLLLEPSLVLNRVQTQFTEKYHMKPDMLLEEGVDILLDELTFKIIATPGHTKGGVTIMLDDMLFTGDTLFAGTCGRTDLYGASEDAMDCSLKKLAALKGDYKVFPGHGEATTLEHERATNGPMRGALGKKTL